MLDTKKLIEFFLESFIMNNVIATSNRVLATSPEGINNVRLLQDIIIETPQANIHTDHIIHSGMYARTIKIPAGVLLTGALIKVGTILIAQGDVIVYVDDKAVELHGYNVFAASAKRKQAFVALSDVYLTTVFPTKAKTIIDAENEFTDEADLLLSRQQLDMNTITITEE